MCLYSSIQKKGGMQALNELANELARFERERSARQRVSGAEARAMPSSAKGGAPVLRVRDV